METINIHNPHVTVKQLSTLAGSAEEAGKAVRILDNQLLTLRLNLGSLRASLEAAFAPIAGAMLPGINAAIRGLRDFCDDVGTVTAALFGTVYKKAVTTAKKTGSALRRSLASFDQINRLQGGSGSGGTQSQTTLVPVNDPMTPALARTVQRIRDLMGQLKALVAPLQKIDFSAAGSAFSRLGEAIGGFGETVSKSLGWAWHNLLVPLAKWTVEEAVPASVELLRSALELLTAALSPLMAGLRTLTESLRPVASFFAGTFATVIEAVRSRFEALAQGFSQRSGQIAQIFQNLGDCFTGLWEKAQPHLEALRSLAQGVFDHITEAAGVFTGHITDILVGLTDFLAGVFTGNWGRAWEGMQAVGKGAVNGIIGILNSLLSGLTAGLNGITAALNKWHVEIPQWVPRVGGKTFGFNLPTVKAPQVPYLARGAVIPANQPFLAVLGDQKRGTNVEAPLGVIQEAVALALEDFLAGNMAGHEATVEVLQELLSAVRDIRLGDDDIAAAVRRSQTRRAVMRGGAYAL